MGIETKAHLPGFVRRIAAGFAAGFVLLALAPRPVAAEPLYKCVNPAGLASIQNAPCGKGSKQVWVRDTAPEPPPTPEQIAAAQARAEAQARERAAADAEAQASEARRLEEEAAAQAAAEAQQAQDSAPVVAPAAEAPAPPDPCDQAKDFVAQVRAKPWLGLDDDQWQRLYGWVVRECSGTQ